jgi:hypothetical protein
VVIAAVDQEDFGIGVPQRVRRRESGKTAADDHDTLALWRRRVDHGCCFLRPIVRQHRAHGLPRCHSWLQQLRFGKGSPNAPAIRVCSSLAAQASL